MADEIITDEVVESPSTELAVDEVETPSTETETEAEPEQLAEETPSEAATTDGEEADGLEKLLTQYKGDKNALVKRHHEVMRQNAEMSRKLKERETPSPRREPEPPKPAEPPASLKAIDDAITALTVQRDAIPAEGAKLYSAIETAQQRVVALEREYAKADDYQKETLEGRLETARTSLETKIDKYKGLADKRQLLDDRIEQKQNARKYAEREHDEQRARQQDEQDRSARIHKEFPDQVNKATDKIVAEMKGLPTDEDAPSIIRRLTKAGTAVRLWANSGVPADQVYPDAVKQTVNDLNRLCELAAKKALRDASTRKLNVTTPRRPAIPAPGDATPRPAYSGGLSDDPKMRAARERLEGRLGK